MHNIVLKVPSGHVPVSVGGAWDSYSHGCEFETHIWCRDDK